MRGLLALIFIAGCAHSPGPELALDEHVPYTAIPADLNLAKHQRAQLAAIERASDVSPGGMAAVPPCPIPKEVRLQRVRALLAALDAHVAALGGRSAEEQERLILQSTATEVRELLAAWPDILAEADELIERTGQLGKGMAINQPPLVQRINQLTDLIRLQLMASQ